MTKSTSLDRISAASSRQHGFSLIELVVAMVVVAILAAIAIPSYSNYVRKSRRTEAKTVLLDLISLEERFYTTNNSYTQDPSQLGYVVTTFPIQTASGYYTITQGGWAVANAATTSRPLRWRAPIKPTISVAPPL
jgi:type IV pilus assembly protein PilE